MENSKTKGGYFQIDNTLIETLSRTHLSGQELRVLFAIIRKTLGWRKDWDRISYSQITEMTGILKQNVHRTIKSLIDRKIIERINIGMFKGYKMRINKNYEQWVIYQGSNLNRLPSSKQITVIKTDTEVSSNPITTKDNTKDINMSTELNPVKNLFIEWNSLMKDREVRKIRFIEGIDSKHPRYKTAKARLGETFFSSSYKEAMQKVTISDFCNGRILQDGRKAWIANIDWFLRPGKVMEILEGKFDNERWQIEEEPTLPSEVML